MRTRAHRDRAERAQWVVTTHPARRGGAFCVGSPSALLLMLLLLHK